MDLMTKLERDVKHLRIARDAGNVALSLAHAKRARVTATMLVRDIANTRDTLHVQEDDKP